MDQITEKVIFDVSISKLSIHFFFRKLQYGSSLHWFFFTSCGNKTSSIY